MFEIGKKLPEFSLTDQTEKEKSFKDIAGENGLVIYVYPKDNTSGCTLEALDFRDRMDAFHRLGYGVAGLSKDSVKSHCNFAGKYDLNFPLLSDTSTDYIQALGAWGEKNMYGKKSMGVIRTTVIADGRGKVIRVYPKVKVKGHVEQVLADLAGL
ncbi:MAG TPA: peroxiredoxin [bacterium]|nr:peroxiredoxin [bacterium]